MLLGEMASFLKNQYGVGIAISTISSALPAAGWLKKIVRRMAQERNADLCDSYLHQVPALSSYQLVFVDESGCDKRAGLRRPGWSRGGVTPIQVARLHRGARYQILPAYAQDGVVFAKFSKAQRMRLSLEITLSSYCITAAAGPTPSPC